MTAMQGSLSHTFLQSQATYIDAANLDQRHLIDRLSRVPRPICQGTIENIFKLKIEIYLRWLCPIVSRNIVYPKNSSCRIHPVDTRLNAFERHNAQLLNVSSTP